MKAGTDRAGLEADVGTFTLTGETMSPLVDHRMPAEAGSFVLSGQNAELHTSNRSLVCAAGMFTLSGQNATLTKSGTAPTWEPANKGSHIVLSGGNLQAVQDGAGSFTQSFRSTTSHPSGKYNFESVVPVPRVG